MIGAEHLDPAEAAAPRRRGRRSRPPSRRSPRIALERRGDRRAMALPAPTHQHPTARVELVARRRRRQLVAVERRPPARSPRRRRRRRARRAAMRSAARAGLTGAARAEPVDRFEPARARRRRGAADGSAPAHGFRSGGDRRGGQRRAGVDGGGAELLGDLDQPVVLGGALAADRGAGLDLAGAEGDGEVGDDRVLGLARSAPRRPPCRRCGGRGRRRRAPRRGCRSGSPSTAARWPRPRRSRGADARVGDEEVVADDLDPARRGQLGEARRSPPRRAGPRS